MIPDKLQNNDIYSLLLFILYKLQKDDKLSTLSELIYILDKSSLLKLLEYYGGSTITIPTIDDLENVVYALSLYNRVTIDKESFNDVVDDLKLRGVQKQLVFDIYNKLTPLMKDIKFRAK